ncbi:MAG TPA: hypothetical protein VIZ68_02940 [Thermoplasmata archaeon]
MAHPEAIDAGPATGTDELRRAEAALRRLGYARVPPAEREVTGRPAFWVQEAGVPRRTFPVYLPPSGGAPTGAAVEGPGHRREEHGSFPPRAIYVVANDRAAEQAWESLRRQPGAELSSELSILVLPPPARSDAEPRWHARTVSHRELLRLSTGVVVGLFRRAHSDEGSTQIDFVELLTILRQRFGVDVHRSLGVTSDEDALFLLYQLALRDSYAPGDPGANLHVLVLKPTGPAARLPWFAA